MLRSLHGVEKRASLEAEQLEGRQVMSVFITPPSISAEAIRHCHDRDTSRGRSRDPDEAGGVITVHIRADDPAGQALLNSGPAGLTETISLNGGPAVPLTIFPRAVGGNGNELELKFSRCDFKAFLGAQLNGLKGNIPVVLTVSNGSGPASASEFGIFFIRATHHTGEGS